MKQEFNLTFGSAIEALKSGSRVTRQGWNGKGMYLTLSADKNSIFINADQGNYLKITSTNQFIVMYTADGTYQPGWLASQADMLSEDWGVIV